jgi:hypothetical protein
MRSAVFSFISLASLTFAEAASKCFVLPRDDHGRVARARGRSCGMQEVTRSRTAVGCQSHYLAPLFRAAVQTCWLRL